MDRRRSSVLGVNEWMKKADGLLTRIVNLVVSNDLMAAPSSNSAANSIVFPQHNEEIINGVHELGFDDVVHFCESFPAKFIIDKTTGIIRLGRDRSNLRPPKKVEETPEIVSLPSSSSSSIPTSSTRSMLQHADIDDETIALLAKYSPIPPSLRTPRRKEEVQKVEPVKQTECIHFKYSHEGKMRRFVVPRDFSYIIGAVKDRVENITGKKDLLLYWRDDESLIVLECGEDMQAAIDFAESQQKPPACIVIETTGEVEDKEEPVVQVIEEEKENQPEGSASQDVVQAPASTNEQAKVVSVEESSAAFDGIAFICDSCDSFLAPSNGGRFKCMVCVNYDLCRDCVEKGAHPNHALVRLLNAETLVPIGEGEKGSRLVKLGETQGCSPCFEAKSTEKPIDPKQIFEAVLGMQKMEVHEPKRAVKLEDLRRRKRAKLEEKTIPKVKKIGNIQHSLEKEMNRLAKSMAIAESEKERIPKEYRDFLSDPEYIKELLTLQERNALEDSDAKAYDWNDYEDEERELQAAIRESEKEARREERKRAEEERLDREREQMRRIDEEREKQRRERAEKQWTEMKRGVEPRLEYWRDAPPRYVRDEPVDFYSRRENTEESTDSEASLIREEELIPESIYKEAAHTLVAPANDENKKPESKKQERRRLEEPVEPVWDWEESSADEKWEKMKWKREEKSIEKETTKIQWPSDLWRSTTSIGNGAYSEKFLKDREDFLTGVDEIDNIPVHLEQILLWEMLYNCEEEALPEKLERFCSLVHCSAQMHVYEKPEKIFTENEDVENEMIRLIAVELASRLQTMKESVGFAIPKIRSKVIASRLGELDERIRKERDANNKYRYAAMQIRPIICNAEILNKSIIVNEGTTYKMMMEDHKHKDETVEETNDAPVDAPAEAPVEKPQPLSRKDSSDGSDIEIIDMLREGSSSSLDKFDQMEAQFVRLLLHPAVRAAAAAPPSTPAAEPAEPTTPATTPAVQAGDLENEPASESSEPEIQSQQPDSAELFSLLEDAASAAAAASLPRNTEIELLQHEEAVSSTWAAADRAIIEDIVSAAIDSRRIREIEKLRQTAKEQHAAAIATQLRETSGEGMEDMFESCTEDRMRRELRESAMAKDREAVLEEAAWRRLSRPLLPDVTPEDDDDDDSPFFSCSEEDPVRGAWMDLEATVTTLKLRREKEEAKSISDDVKHIPVCMEYNILLELHDMDNTDEMHTRLGAYCGQVSKNAKKEFKEHKTIFSEHKDIENMIIKQIAADLSKRLKNMKRIVDYASPPTRRRMILNRVCELRAQIKEFKYNKVLFQSVCSELHIILLTNEYTVSYNPMESLDRGWKYLYDHAKGFVDTAKANAPTLGQLLHPSAQRQQSTSSSGKASWDPWEEEFPSEPTAPATPAIVPSAPAEDDGFIPLVEDPVDETPMTEQQQILLAKLFETGIFEDYDRMTQVCRKAKTLEQAIEMMIDE